MRRPPPQPSGSDRATVLIVDDEPRILSAMRRTLRREGYALLLAASPAEALACLDDRAVDLVLSDQMMPGMRGTELLAEVARRQPRAARMLITGWTEAVDAEALARCGIGEPLTKPWEDAELKEALRKALAQVGRAL